MTATAKNTPKLDKMGCRVGSKRAKINAALTSKPQTMAEIMKKAKVKQTHYNHLAQMAEKGFVDYDQKAGTYALKGGKKTKAAPKKKAAKKIDPVKAQIEKEVAAGLLSKVS